MANWNPRNISSEYIVMDSGADQEKLHNDLLEACRQGSLIRVKELVEQQCLVTRLFHQTISGIAFNNQHRDIVPFLLDYYKPVEIFLEEDVVTENFDGTIMYSSTFIGE